MRAALTGYVADVREGRFPDIDRESFHGSNSDEIRKLYPAAAEIK